MRETALIFKHKPMLLAGVLLQILVVCLLFVGVLHFVQSVYIFNEQLHKQMNIIVMLKDDINSEQQSFIEYKLSKVGVVESFTFISPSAVDSIIIGNSGEDLSSILGFSAVPGNYIVKLKKMQISQAGYDAVIREIREYPGVTEIVHEKQLSIINHEVFPRAILYVYLFLSGIVLTGLLIALYGGKTIVNAFLEVQNFTEDTQPRFKKRIRKLRVQFLVCTLFLGLLASGIYSGLMALSYISNDVTLIPWWKIIAPLNFFSIFMGIFAFLGGKYVKITRKP